MQTTYAEKIQRIAPYKKRFVRHVQNLNILDWDIKLYWISWKNEIPDPTLVQRSTGIIKKRLAAVEDNFTNYRVGFSMIHEGKDGTYVIISYWIEENMLDHVVLLLDDTKPEGYKRIEPNTIVTCVWELEVLYFEKKAWIDEVLVKKNLSEYLTSNFSLDI